MITPPLSARLATDHLKGVLRVDAVRHDTLTLLAAAWADGSRRQDVIDALDHLGALVASPTVTEGELDAGVEAVEDAACMEYAEVSIDRGQARRLRAELGRVEAALTLPRVGDASVPQQRGQAGAA